MTTLPEEAVKAAQNAIRTANWEYGITDADMAKAITAALPFLPVQGAVKKLEWGGLRYTEDYSFAQDAETSIGRYIATDNGWFLQGQSDWKSEDDIEAAKAAAQADYEARILSALEPSAARELALEEHLHAIEQQLAVNLGYFHDEKRFLLETLQAHITTRIAAIRALSSPDHADAGKVEGDGWLPITDGLNAIGFEIGGGYVLKLSYDSLDQYEAARTAIRSALPSAPSEGAE